MIGFCEVDTERECVTTHRDSYLLHNLTVVSVRKPFLPAGMLFGAGFAGFTYAFSDLLYPAEIATTLGLSALALTVSWQIGQLKLLSRDLRGSELSGVIWGRFASLNRRRQEIVHAVAAMHRRDDQ